MNPNDPLNQLADIHLPSEISSWPPAYGWWIITVLILIVAYIAIRWFIIRRKNNQYKVEAATLLSEIKSQYQSSNATLTALEAINN